MGIRITWACK